MNEDSKKGMIVEKGRKRRKLNALAHKFSAPGP
jgi:hypothetical protein